VSKTVSARITKETHEKLTETCNKIGCTLNDYLNGAIELTLTGSTQQDLGDGIDGSDEPEPEEQNQSDRFPKYELELNFGKITDKEGNLLGYLKGFPKPVIKYLEE
jgi:ABC-type transport system involved in cytochrome bd biosynthesis fused ATPase/permease subunit